MNVLNATQLYMLKWLILRYVDFTLIKKNLQYENAVRVMSEPIINCTGINPLEQH